MASETDRRLVIAEFNRARFPSGSPTLAEAALGIYQVLLWYDEEVDLLHINEVSELRKNAWASRANLAETYLSTQLDLSPEELRERLDRMMRLPRWRGKQRHNPLGNGLRTLIAEVLERFGSPTLTVLQEEDATNWFPGIYLPGRSDRPKVDVLIAREAEPRAVISCKWSIRHDRISDPTNECVQYKAAAVQRQLPSFEYYLLTNEFSPARLNKVLNQPCVDRLVHLHGPLLTTIAGPASGDVTNHPKFMDLTQFVAATVAW